MDITLAADSATIEPSGSRNVSVEINNVDKDEILDNFTVSDCISHFSAVALLNEIGEDECKEHFGLIEDNS